MRWDRLPLTAGIVLVLLATPGMAGVTQSHEGSYLSHEPFVPEDPQDPKHVSQREPADPCVEPWRDGLWGACVALDTPVEGSIFVADTTALVGDAEHRTCFYDAQGTQLECVGPGYGDDATVGMVPEDAARVGIAGITGQQVHWSLTVYD